MAPTNFPTELKSFLANIFDDVTEELVPDDVCFVIREFVEEKYRVWSRLFERDGQIHDMLKQHRAKLRKEKFERKKAEGTPPSN